MAAEAARPAVVIRAAVVPAVLVLLIAVVALGCRAGGTTPAETTDSAVETDDVYLHAAGDSTVYGVGDRVKVGHELYIQLGAVEMDVEPVDVAPPADTVVAAFLVAFEGIDPAGSFYDHLTVQDDRGFEYTGSIHAKEPALEFSDGADGRLIELAPGQKVHGWVTFEVPRASRSLDLVYTHDVRFVVRFRVPGSPAK